MEAQEGQEKRALGFITTPIHSESLIFDNRLYSLIIVQDGNPRIEWTRETERGRMHSVSFDRIIGARMSMKEEATFEIFWVDSEKSQLRTSVWKHPKGHQSAVLLCDALDCLIHGLAPGSIFPERILHVFVNPNSGVPGKAFEIWNHVLNIFTLAHIKVEQIITTHQGHAEEYCKTLNLENYKDGILCVSGDGVLNEIVNGLLSRDDWKEASKIPLGIIPAGSGNGMARSLEISNHTEAALVIVKGKTESLDTFSVIANNNRRYAILSTEWGVLASIDFDSEAVRFMGGARFHLWAFLKLISRQSYQGELSYLEGRDEREYLPQKDRISLNKVEQKVFDEMEKEMKANEFAEMMKEYGIEESEDEEEFAAKDEKDDQKGAQKQANQVNQDDQKGAENDETKNEDIKKDPENDTDQKVDSKKQLENQIRSESSGTLVAENHQIINQSIQAVNQEVATSSDQNIRSTNSNPDMNEPSNTEVLPPIDLKNLHGPPLHYLPERSQDWVTISGTFVLFLAANTTHLAKTVNSAPKASLSDGLIDLIVIRKPSRSVLLRMIMAMEKGTHVDDPDVMYIKAKAFSIRPLIKDKRHQLMGIDGEKIYTDNLQVEVHPSLLKVFCNPELLTEVAMANPHSFISRELARLDEGLTMSANSAKDQ